MAEATPNEIAEVRRRVDELTNATYSDDLIKALVLENGLVGACLVIWTEKAAAFAALTDISEAGASHKLSDLHKNALAMAKVYSDLKATEDSPPAPSADRVRVSKIVRT